LREVLASIRAAEPEWELWLVLGEDGPLAGIARDLGVEVVVRPFPPALARLGDAGRQAVWGLLRGAGAATAYAAGLGRLLRRIKPDLIHSNGFKMHLLGAWTRPPQTPVLWHIHDYVSSRHLVSRLLRWSGGACTLGIANSRSVARDLQALLPRLPIVPIYNAVDLARFSPAGPSADLDALAGLAPAESGTVRVGLVATFARWKGHKVFLEALARLRCAPRVRGYIIGGPIYQTDGSQWSLAELKQEADRFGLRDKVGFTGFIQDAAGAIRGLDVLVHASTRPEPFGMVIIEGMACGKPVIASQAGGAEELFVDGVNGLAHPPGDAGMLASQIQRLACDEGLRQRLGSQGRVTAQRLYHSGRLAQELTAVYRQVWEHPDDGLPPTVWAGNGTVVQHSGDGAR
jgi:glycosyltransferase involved in cell wall biosynthesis